MSADRWTDAVLDSLSRRGDPEADTVIRDLMESGQVESVSTILRAVVRNTQPPPGDLPESVRSYLLAERSRPDWADPDLIRRGTDFFARYGLQIGIALMCASLAEPAMNWRYAHTLHLTGRADGDTRRRFLETAQFVFDVMAPDGLGIGGAGIASALRVRLMHAAIRHLIKEAGETDPTVWRPEWGEPISQEDMAAVLMTFPVMALDAIRKLGTPIPEADEAAYFHAWRVVGHFLGVDEDVLPDTPAEGRALLERQRERYYRVTPRGIALEAALVGILQGMSPAPMRDLPIAYIRLFIGDTYADLLGVPGRPRWRRRLFSAFLFFRRGAGRFVGESGLAEAVAPFMRSLLVGMMELTRGGERPAYSIPERLRRDWQVEATPGD